MIIIKKKFLYTAIIFLFFISFYNLLTAQISQGGFPPSFKSNDLKNNFQEVIVQKPNVEQLFLEDAENDKQATPLRFGKLLEVNFDINNSGSWTEISGKGRIWRLKITSEGALALGIYYNDFHIPQGGQLFLYNENKSQVIGAFTEVNNTKNKLFATELIQGETTILEYFEPYGVYEKPEISISEISYAYRSVDFLFTKGTDDFGGSGPCEVNVNCLEGDDWQEQKRSVARVLVKRSGSSMWCTGSLVNNTMEDCLPYFLTADHCGKYSTADNINQWIFYFNYESSFCPNPQEEPSSNTIVGAKKKASFAWEGGSDFFLVLLNQGIPSSYNPYFGGWNRKNLASTNGVAIHHPEGDIKKISTYTLPTISSTWGETPNTHWKVYWAETENGHGVTEPGSSGCPLYDNDGRVIGTLTGGQASCTNLNGPDWFGKFSYSWDLCGNDSTSQLKYWLDPINKGVNQLDGTDVCENLIANFKADTIEIPVNTNLTFEDLSIGEPNTWSWTFEGALPSTSNYKNPSGIFYAEIGKFKACLFVSNDISQDSVCKYITVRPTIAPNPTSGEVDIYLGNRERNDVEINVFNLLGKEVPFHWKTINSTNYKINLVENDRGMYLIQIICSEEIYNLKTYLIK
ncbi:MAG: T9SS type A sorting domain-containing protein [Bacteroidales bacterium]|nr:T9SS type A sorting domain-containing protein [Bacteroidales bacterium]